MTMGAIIAAFESADEERRGPSALQLDGIELLMVCIADRVWPGENAVNPKSSPGGLGPSE
jgi:hypothetical protein